jgi:glycosyltransferase involved in cell wall biosynthesis
MNPLISVIIPAYNNSETILTAIDSIQKQSYTNLEILVVNDHSTDDTADKVRTIALTDNRIKLITSDFVDEKRYDKNLQRNINAGYSARNTGLNACTGELITFQDGDDASLLNRIEVQYDQLKKKNATHVCLDWQPFDETLLGKKLNVEEFRKKYEIKTITPEELYKLSQKTKGCVAKISLDLNAATPFAIKRKRVLHRLFFGSLASYPGAGNSPLFRREVIEKVRFRKLSERIWPSFMGRGADRDFNFQVAETFKNSYVIMIPLYMWKQPNKNENYSDDLKKYIV